MKELIGVCSKTIEYSQFTKTGYRDKQFEHCCLSLKELCLFTGSVYIGSEAMQLFNPYGLRLLTLTEMHIDSDTLIYISARCESLSHVVMDRLTVLGTISANKGTLLIDMSSARLAELRFSHIRFIPPGEIDLLKPARLIASYPRTIDSDEHINQSSTPIQSSGDSESQTRDMDLSRGYITFMCGNAKGCIISWRGYNSPELKLLAWNCFKNRVEDLSP
ncbi:hypothetical protein J3Q64DRAFT_1881996 [Phycomyces blakesleeanus]|uniref:Uncharacterized protein n=1 Tax=Phycomyces blakesleeanus TaxID=4837 RepID=A0ABR3B3Y8_PHYBL